MEYSYGEIILLSGIFFVWLILCRLIKGYNRGMVYVQSDIDNEYYLVRNYPDKNNASNMLANLKAELNRFVDHLISTTKQNEFKQFSSYIVNLHAKMKYIIFAESSDSSIYTSYCVNKGDEIVFCIRSKSLRSNDIHDLNLIMYVALHEISHIACPEMNHTELFKNIFRFICTEAVNYGIYKKIDFAANPTEYCGMIVSASVI